MKINSVSSALNFTAQDKNVEFNANKKKKEKKYKDPLANWPMRGLGYTNDIGVAINEIAPTAATLFWVPALMYFGADVYDKYKNKGNKYDPNAQRAFKQAVFQAFASIILPTVFGHIGQSAFSQIDKYKGEKISTNAKEQTLRFIKHHAQDHDIVKDGDKTQVLEKFENNFNIFFSKKKESYQGNNIFTKMYDKLLCNCKRGAIANSNEERLKNFAKKEFENILEHGNSTDIIKSNLDKKIFKLKAWKSLGSFIALLLTVKPIDMFTENVIIKKCVEPQMKKLNAHSNIEKQQENNNTQTTKK